MKRRKQDKGASVRIVMGIMALIIVTLGYQGIRLVQVSQQLDQQIKQTQKEISAESQRLEALETEYANINSLQNIEKVARDKLGLVKEDEIVFRVQP